SRFIVSHLPQRPNWRLDRPAPVCSSPLPVTLVRGAGLSITAPTALFRSARLALTRAEIAEHVIIAGGGVVADDDRQPVGAREAARRDVDAAARAWAGCAASPRAPAVGVVVFARVLPEGECREGVLVDPAAQAIAAIAAIAADGEVAGHRTVADSERRAEEVCEAAAPGVAA